MPPTIWALVPSCSVASAVLTRPCIQRWVCARASTWLASSAWAPSPASHPRAQRCRPLACARHGRRSEEHTSELQSPCNLVCRLLLEKKNKHISPASRRIRWLFANSDIVNAPAASRELGTLGDPPAVPAFLDHVTQQPWNADMAAASA